MEKHELILKNLRERLNSNNRFCMLNNCPPGPYMEGANKILSDMIEFIKNLK